MYCSSIAFSRFPLHLFAFQSHLFNLQITTLAYIIGVAYVVKFFRSKESIITFSKVRRLDESE